MVWIVSFTFNLATRFHFGGNSVGWGRFYGWYEAGFLFFGTGVVATTGAKSEGWSKRDVSKFNLCFL